MDCLKRIKISNFKFEIENPYSMISIPSDAARTLG
jgi:hypothetical protein